MTESSRISLDEDTKSAFVSAFVSATPAAPAPTFPTCASMKGKASQEECAELEFGPSTTSPTTLCFRSAELEEQYLSGVAKDRWPILISICCFDAVTYFFRLITKFMVSSQGAETLLSLGRDMAPQLGAWLLLYSFLYLLNKRSRRLGGSGARQEDLLLAACMATAVCTLLANLAPTNAGDYVYACYFLICSTTLLKIRWWVGTAAMATPALLAHLWHLWKGIKLLLPNDSLEHVAVAWAVGGLMSYVSEGYRRKMFASELMAASAHQKELLEAKARIKAQRQLAAAQAQAAHRALTVTREKASNEAKSDFMSLMCHEVRTPLNGCLASAEMLLETPLEEEQRELAKTICVSGAILLSTVSNFLDFFKLEAGKALDVVRTEVGLSDLVKDVHCIIEAMVGRGSGDVALLEPRIHGSLPARVLCDPDRVRGVLLNLYTNAAKFTRSGHIGLRVSEVSSASHTPGPASAPYTQDEGYCLVMAAPLIAQPVVGAGGTRLRPPHGCAEQMSSMSLSSTGAESVSGAETHSGVLDEVQGRLGGEASTNSSGGGLGSSAEASSRWMLFEVFDTGVGIQPEGLRTLFKEYVQGTEDEMKKPRSRGGTGLGLSICSKQVGVLGGRIGAYSSPGRGSTFWFTIPLIEIASDPIEELLLGMAPRSNLQKPVCHRLASSGSDSGCRSPPCSGVKEVIDPSVWHPLPDVGQEQDGGGAAASTNPTDVTCGSRCISLSSERFWPGTHRAVGTPPTVSTPTSTFGGMDLFGPEAECLLRQGGGRRSPPGEQMEIKSKSNQRLRRGADGGTCDAAWSGRSPSLLSGRLSASSASDTLPPSLLLAMGSQSGIAGVQLAGHCLLPPRCSTSNDLLRGMRVLLVEDNIINQTVARKLLTSLGLICEVASNGLEAVQAVQSKPPLPCGKHYYDIILMDMSMPVMGGVEATRAIRQLPLSSCPRVPILAMTANASDRDRDECRSAGMDGFLCKPVLKDRLVGAMLQVIDGSAWDDGRYEAGAGLAPAAAAAAASNGK